VLLHIKKKGEAHILERNAATRRTKKNMFEVSFVKNSGILTPPDRETRKEL
jgi:hypothetical protein